MAFTGYLSKGDSIILNMHLARMYGLDAAILLGALANEYDLAEARDEIDDDGYFCAPVNHIKEKTRLSYKLQRRAIELLKEDVILDVKAKGIPAKRYLRVNVRRLAAMLKDKTEDRHAASV